VKAEGSPNTTHKLYSCSLHHNCHSCCSCMVTFDYNALTYCKSASQCCVFLALASQREKKVVCFLGLDQREREVGLAYAWCLHDEVQRRLQPVVEFF
jgi:hypothetical protein